MSFMYNHGHKHLRGWESYCCCNYTMELHWHEEHTFNMLTAVNKSSIALREITKQDSHLSIAQPVRGPMKVVKNGVITKA